MDAKTTERLRQLSEWVDYEGATSLADKLTAVRAAFLDAAISSRAAPGAAMDLLAATIIAIRQSVCAGGDPASSIGKLLNDYLNATISSRALEDGGRLQNTQTDVSNIILDTQIRKVASGTSGIIATTASKYIEIDSGTNGAEILAVIINGVVGFDWTLSIFVPTADAVAAPAAADKRDKITYLAADTEGGLLGPFAIAYNAFLKFTNDSAGNQTVNDCLLVYRSRGAVSISAWV